MILLYSLQLSRDRSEAEYPSFLLSKVCGGVEQFREWSFRMLFMYRVRIAKLTRFLLFQLSKDPTASNSFDRLHKVATEQWPSAGNIVACIIQASGEALMSGAGSCSSFIVDQNAFSLKITSGINRVCQNVHYSLRSFFYLHSTHTANPMNQS